MKWREEMISNPKLRITHGGIIGALIDVAADFALAAKLGMPVPTVDLRVDYHRVAEPGDLVARGRVVRLGGTNAVAEASVHDARGPADRERPRGLFFRRREVLSRPGALNGERLAQVDLSERARWERGPDPFSERRS